MRGPAAVIAALVVLTPARAEAGAPAPAVALTASPARVTLVGDAGQAIRVSNTGARPVRIDAAAAGFALDLHGRPRIVRGDASARWLRVRPRELDVAPGSSGTLRVAAAPPPGAPPGDHVALVLLATRPRQGAAVAVRMRIGVSVVMRVPGIVERHLELRSLGVRPDGRARMLEVGVANTGNVVEALRKGRMQVSLVAAGQVRTRLESPPRDLLPHTTGICELRYGGRLRGWLTARVTLATGGKLLTRSFRIRL
jgi:hypothetical protein